MGSGDAILAEDFRTEPSRLRGGEPAPEAEPSVLRNAEAMPRRQLLETLQAHDVARKKLIFIVARAGQGKTTFARQLLDGFADPFSWYQISASDRDPVTFISSFVASLCSTHHISLPTFQKLLEGGAITAAEPRRFAKLLADELRVAVKGPLRLVFDDIHLIEESPLSLLFLRTLIETSAFRLRFVLLSRRELLPELLPQSKVLIDNESLALTRSEVAELCTAFLGVSVSSAMVDRVYNLTEGWVMGVSLALQSLASGEFELVRQQLDQLQGEGRSALLHYFQAEVLERFSGDLRQTLIHLSLLENIPADLAEILSTPPGIRQVLNRLNAQRLFVRRLDGEDEIFIFHHLFQETLRAVARAELSSEEQQQIFTQAAAWFERRNRLVEALDYYLQARDYSRAESILQQVGLMLVTSNQILTLKGILDRLPESCIRANAWLSFYGGVIELQTEPQKAYAQLEWSRTRFIEQADLVGEFFASTQLIFFHCLVDGLFVQAWSLLKRAEVLDTELADSLNDVARFHALTILSIGFSYVDADIAKSNYYSGLALKLAEGLGYENFIFSALLAQIYHHGFRGDWFGLRKISEKLTALSGAPVISRLNLAICDITTTNLLEMEGDFDNYVEQRDAILTGDSFEMAEKTTFKPFLLVWDADMAIARGGLDQAALAIREGLDGDGAASIPHLRSQYLHYQAYLFALRGEKDAAVSTARESLKLREQAGGRYFVALNQTVLGATYVQLGLWEEAESLLAAAFEFYVAVGNEFDLAAVHAHRACLRLSVGEETAALEDIRQMLHYLKKNSYVHFFSWTPSLMEKLLAVAVSHNIETEYAQLLARERLRKALRADGTLVPLLRIRTLGALALGVVGSGKITNSQLTPGQRELVALLIAAPDQRLPIGEIQLVLWPMSSARQARSKFDNLVLRLRKVLDQNFGARASRSYLVLEKGILALCHVQIDVVVFQRKVQEGLEHKRRKNFWQSKNALRSACRLWMGEFAPCAQSAERVCDYRRDLRHLYLKAAFHLSEILAGNGQLDEAIRVAEQALRFDRTNEPLIRAIYNYHSQRGDLLGARKIMKCYEEALAKDGCNTAEIGTILEIFWVRP